MFNKTLLGSFKIFFFDFLLMIISLSLRDDNLIILNETNFL